MEEVNKIPYLCLYRSYLEELEVLTDEEVGRLVRCMLHYLLELPLPELTGVERVLWPRMRSQHDRDVMHYAEVRQMRREAGQKGVRARKQSLPLVSNGDQSLPLVSNGDQSLPLLTNGDQSLPLLTNGDQNQAKVAIERDIEKEKESEKEREKKFILHNTLPYPSLEDVVLFCKQEGLSAMDPERFLNYNEAVGWVINGKPIQDWRAAARIWNDKDIQAGKAAGQDTEELRGDFL